MTVAGPQAAERFVESATAPAIPTLPQFDLDTPLSAVYKALLQGRPAVMVTDADGAPLARPPRGRGLAPGAEYSLDRIVLTVPEKQRELAVRHGDWIAREVLATELRVAGEELALEKV